MEFKSISLSVKDIDRLLSINDDERREVREFMARSMAEPESVHAEEYRDSSPTIYKFARRIERRVKSARRRAERKQPLKTELPAIPTATREETTVSCVVLESYNRNFKSILTRFNDHLDLMISRFNIFENPTCDNAAFMYLTDLRDRVKSLLSQYIARQRPDIHPQAASITFPTAI